VRATHWTYEKTIGGAWARQTQSCPKTGTSSDKIEGAVYVITRALDVIYVGETGRGLVRLDDGFRQGTDQPIAYKWRSSSDIRDSTLLGVVFDSFSLSYDLKNQIDRKALEADVAVLFYTRRGLWPRMLTSISVHGGVSRSGRHLQALDEISRYLMENKYLPTV
jgi:hypothetical protein